MHRRTVTVDAVFRELNFPCVGIGGIILPEPSREDADIPKRNDAVIQVIVGAKFGAEKIRRIRMERQHPVAISEFRYERFEIRIDAVGMTDALAEVMVERNENLGIFLFFFDGVIGGVVVVGINASPCIEIAIAEACASRIEPVVRIDFVVNDEIGDASIAFFAVEIFCHKTGKAPVVGGHAVDRRAKDRGLHVCAAALCPGGDAVDDGRHDDAAIRIFADGVDDCRVDIEAITVEFVLTGMACRRARRLPFGPNEVHGDAVYFVPDDLLAILEIRL